MAGAVTEPAAPSRESRTSRAAGRRLRRPARRGPFVLALVLGIAFVAAYHPSRSLEPYALWGRPVVAESAAGALAPRVGLSERAFGYSGGVRVLLALPGSPLAPLLEVHGETTGIGYRWRELTTGRAADTVRPLAGDTVVAPTEAGLYQLMLVQDGARRVIDGLTLAVLVPFERKHGPVLDGYRIGMYRAERGAEERPAGFVKVMPNGTSVPISRHLRLGDLLTRDGQETWPRYVAVDPRLLDKLELVMARITASAGGARAHVLVNIQSAFRTPAYNRRVPLAAPDSRHQYGDAVDVAIDADGDGRFDAADAKRVAAVVDSVEAEHPDLAGGLGLYTSRRYRHPYVHIDARGTRVRWRG
jgi:uncharacterized protein YcbK (DUF882 family)